VSTVPLQGTISRQQSPLDTQASCTGSSDDSYSSRHPPCLLRARLRCCCEPGPPPSLRTVLPPPPPPPPPRLPLPVAPPAEPLACLLLPPRCVRLGFSLGFQAPLPRCCVNHVTAQYSTTQHSRPLSNTPRLQRNGAGRNSIHQHPRSPVTLRIHATDQCISSDNSNSNMPAGMSH